MHILRPVLLSLALALLFLACGGPSAKDNPILQEAFAYHNKALDSSKEFKSLLDGLTQQKNSLQVQGRELTAEEMARIDQINSLEKAFKGWESNAVEVPGFGHSHDHGQCNHDHSQDLKLTPEQMLEVQKESLQGIKDLTEKARELSQG